MHMRRIVRAAALVALSSFLGACVAELSSGEPGTGEEGLSSDIIRQRPMCGCPSGFPINRCTFEPAGRCTGLCTYVQPGIPGVTAQIPCSDPRVGCLCPWRHPDVLNYPQFTILAQSTCARSERSRCVGTCESPTGDVAPCELPPDTRSEADVSEEPGGI